ncbi:hypothetical protein AVEN_2026-1 [Araneus ventricosus]|uniref:Transposable element P transposase n=1 Tax=Araneus ventricosus TaxID=182803 RepID=A0A4Y2PU37_ARAVE|nr:hypothetical protein AVEN_2026-1 [Araneus ventricosus]
MRYNTRHGGVICTVKRDLLICKVTGEDCFPQVGCGDIPLCGEDPHKPSITGWQVTLSAFLLLIPELFEEKKFVLLSRFNQDALENYFSQVRRMTIPLQWTSCTWTRMLLAELMFTMCGNANYEPDDNIILKSTQIILQTDEDCLDLVIDEPSWIAQKHRKIGMIWSSTVPLMWHRLHFKKKTSANLL